MMVPCNTSLHEEGSTGWGFGAKQRSLSFASGRRCSKMGSVARDLAISSRLKAAGKGWGPAAKG